MDEATIQAFEGHNQTKLISLSHGNNRDLAKRPVLFVPGAFSGSWIWRDTFMQAFFDAGHDVYAFSFRGHGKPSWKISLNRLEAYVEDMQLAIAKIPHPPVVIAHSMGGFVTLKLLEKQTLPGAMLLSAVPPDGILFSLLKLGFKSPVSILKLMSLTVTPFVRKLGSPPVGIYSDTIDKTRAKKITSQLQAESLWVLAELLRPEKIDVTKIQTPLHLYGAEGDHIIPASEVRKAANFLNSPVTIFPGMSHTFQAETNWRLVAEEMFAFVDTIS